MTATLMSQADFARYRGVSRKSVTVWKQRGYLVMDGDLVDVQASDVSLAANCRQRNWQPPAPAPSPPAPPLPNTVLTASVIVNGSAADIFLAIRRHLPRDEARRVAEEIMACMRPGTVEMLDGDSADGLYPLPDGMTSWAQHPAFTEPPLNEREWAELEQEFRRSRRDTDANAKPGAKRAVTKGPTNAR